MQKQPININFSQGLDTKSDPRQVSLGRFSALENTVFTKEGLLQKRNGYDALPTLPDATSNYVTTFNGALTAIGSKLEAFSSASNTWTNKGKIQPVQLDVLPLIRNNTNQSQADSAISSTGLICTVYTDQDPSSLSAKIYRYVVADSVTGQNIVAPTTITEADATLGTPRVFLLGSYFIVIFTNKVSTTYHLKYFAINTVVPTTITAPADISTSYTPSSTVAFDAIVMGNALFVAWNGASSSGIKVAYLTAQLSLSSSVNPDAAHVATMVSVCADAQNRAIWVSYFASGTSNGYTFAVDPNLAVLSAAAIVISSKSALNITSSALSGINTIFYEVSNNYSYDGAIPSHFINSVTRTQAGVTGSTTTILRSVGLASKSFIIGSTLYLLTAFQSPYQPSYFLIDSTGAIIAKLAYSNGGGYLLAGLPEVNVSGTTARVTYLIKDSISAVNKGTNLPSGTQVNGIYSQTGINLASFEIGGQVASSEIGQNLNLTGGFLWGYDGYVPVENNFFVWPDSVELTGSGSGGNLAAATYFYQATYEWADNQGNVFRSAPSIPVQVMTTGTTSSVTVNVPTLRLTYKTSNPVKIVIYRWSSSQQIYYQVTSLTAPVLNSTTTDSIAFVDTLADASILGNNILYTNGGVVENIGPPAASAVDLFDDRLWLIDAEDKNLLWYSKQVIETTPVEMSDLFTLYVAPTTAAQGSTGPMRCIAPMDDKQVIFKDNAIFYINGTGPDNAGANGQYSQPIFVTSTVGSDNPASIVFIPNGLMFQSDKGIWLLGRNLGTTYIGAPVEQFNEFRVLSAVNIPGTNQVRFTLENGVTLMYDYYYNQWGTFIGVPAVSSTLYQNLHTFINSYGQVLQESPGSYLDGSNPVLIKFTTGWINFAGLRGYERIYEFSFLGTYLSPHKLAIQVAYDYGPVEHQSMYSPNNFSPVYGSDSLYGGSTTYGGPSDIEQFRVFAKRQKCKAFQISVQEIYDPSFGVVAGAGLNLSGINFVVALKKGWAPTPGVKSVG